MISEADAFIDAEPSPQKGIITNYINNIMKSNTDNINAGWATIRAVQALKITMAEISPIIPNLTGTTITRSRRKGRDALLEI